MIYIDSSSLLKLLIPEPESESVAGAIANERSIVVSPLTELEVMVQLRSKLLSGICRRKNYNSLVSLFGRLRTVSGFSFSTVSGGVFAGAIRQNEVSPVHCRSLDRLHLAIMEELGISRLMTNDKRQAKAAIDWGMDVITPAWE